MTPTELLEQFVRCYAPKQIVNGELCINHNGDTLFVAAFAALGWANNYPAKEAA